MPLSDRVLMGPGPCNPYPDAVEALARPMLGHLDPEFVGILDETCDRLRSVFRTSNPMTLPISGTGSAGMEAAFVNLVVPGDVVVIGVNGVFGARMCDVASRCGAEVVRVDVPWGQPVDPERLLAAHPSPAAIAVVHAETSTGVRNPVQEIAGLARAHDALVLVDAVTSLGGMPLEVAAWDVDACYSGSQKCLGAPSGLAPIVFTPRALARRVPCRSFYLDLGLLQDYWVGHKYHHTIAATLVFALREALAIVEEEGLEARWARHERHHRVLTAGLEAMGLPLYPPPGERLHTLHTVRVPEGVDEAAVRRDLREAFNIEVGAGMGPLAGKVWRVGLMGAGSVPSSILILLGALEHLLRRTGHAVEAGAGTAAALEALG